MSKNKCSICGTAVVIEHCVGDERNTGIECRDGEVMCWECHFEDDIRVACEDHARQNAEMAEEERLEKTYPLMMRLAANKDKRAITQFLIWAANTRGLKLWKSVDPMYPMDPREVFVAPNVNELILEYLGIDPKALENERRAMLDKMGDS